MILRRLICAALLFLIVTGSVAIANDRPNIVLILADDMSWYGTGTPMKSGLAASAGTTRRTPSINELAVQGMTFSRAFAPAGICAPSRCSIQTGMSTARTRFTGNGNFGSTSREVTYDGRRNKGRLMLEPSPLGSLDPNQDTIAEYLKALGYATAHVGKWHIYGGGPGEHGYDVHDGETGNEDGNSEDPRDPKHIFSMTRKAIEFIQEKSTANRPFYVQISHYAEHNAVQYRSETLKACLEDDVIRRIRPNSLRSRVARRSAMVEDMDTSIGLLLDKLNELGIRDHTYVVFTSDNGHHRDTGEQKILRGTKWWLWEGGIRVPMIVTGPGIQPGSRCDTNVVGYDFLPTFVALAGGSSDSLKLIDGADITPLLKGESNAKLAGRTLYFHYPHHRNSAMHSAVIQGDHKFFRFYERPDSLYLYDLKSNIGENENLSDEKPGVAARLQREMDRYFDSIEACLPKPNPVRIPKYIPFDPDVPEQGAEAASRPSQPKISVQSETRLSPRQVERKKRRELRTAEQKQEQAESSGQRK
jgi:arylsulfatase A-like enzyme